MFRRRAASMHFAGHPVFGRSAFTLLELLLALAVLVTLATLSWPSLMGTLKQQTVQGNAEQVRQVLDRARVRAVEEGQTLQFRFEPQGKRYVLLPWEPLDESGTNTSASTSGSSSTTSSSVRIDPYRVYQLAEGCYFHVDSTLLSGEKQVSEQLGESWIGHLENGTGLQDVSWSAPILYYADGSATDGSTVVMDKDERYVKLNVRGLTAAVWSEPVARLSGRLDTTGK